MRNTSATLTSYKTRHACGLNAAEVAIPSISFFGSRGVIPKSQLNA